MISWLARIVMIAAGFVTSWFLAKNAPLFGIVQVMAMIILLTLTVAVIAFWPHRRTSGLKRVRRQL